MALAYLVRNSSSTALRALNYTPEVEAFKRRARTSDVLRLGELLSAMGPAYGKVFVRYDCSAQHGDHLLTQGDMFAAEPNGRVIRGDAIRNVEDHRVHRWQILIAAAGTLGENELYGRSIIADNRLEGCIVGPHAMALRFEEPGSVENLYAYAFLASPTGIRVLRSASYGTKILGIRKDILSELPIPKPDRSTMARVAELVREAVELREVFRRQEDEARAVVESLPAVQEALELCRDRKARCLLWGDQLPTLTGKTYVFAGEALRLLRSRWQAQLGDLLEEDGLFNGPRFARRECRPPHGVRFLGQRDVHMIRPVPRRIIPPNVDPGLLYVQEGTLLLGSHGQMTEGSLFGRVVWASRELDGAALTQDILRMKVVPEFASTVYAFLSTTLGLRLMQSTACGTSIPSMRLDLVASTPVPTLDDTRRGAVTDAVEKAVEARVSANEREAEAIRIIEEEVLPEWLA